MRTTARKKVKKDRLDALPLAKTALATPDAPPKHGLRGKCSQPPASIPRVAIIARQYGNGRLSGTLILQAYDRALTNFTWNHSSNPKRYSRMRFRNECTVTKPAKNCAFIFGQANYLLKICGFVSALSVACCIWTVASKTWRRQ